jgi:hypothetical protein
MFPLLYFRDERSEKCAFAVVGLQKSLKAVFRITVNLEDILLYTGLFPVESVSWILLSAGAKLEPRSGLRGESYLF